MPLTDVIDNYANGATGTLPTASGGTVGYTVSGNSPTVDWDGFGTLPLLDGGARVNANGTETFTVTFDTPVVGAAMQISGSDSTEIYFIEVDGVVVNLQTLIDNGDVTLTQSGAATHTISPTGGISGGTYTDGSVAELVFNIPVTSLGAFGTGAASFNWDYFEVGIDTTLFDVVCFAKGTLIATDIGSRRVETLRVGDLVQTQGDRAKRIVWIGSRRFDAADLANCAKLRPVRIEAGALGNGLPERDLLVSRQHRMVVSSKIAARMFGVSDVLIPAIRLTALPGIYVDETIEAVEYFHVLLDQHEVIFAEGAPTESLFTGQHALQALSKEAREEILTIFPALADLNFVAQPAMPLPLSKQQKQLVERHVKNDQALLQSFTN